ncbi:epsin protein [Dioscorea alata]|uniref:Epsin protein n=1 Tax=Dioscorea alata TaxID=55571 RepID=A0ACB7WSC6_DIOAL|nr:epsin protein [Dioscorea alata]
MKKAFDQTVRDLKREVNKKVLKVPGIEQKILDATSNEPWGPHGSLLADIAQASRNHYEYQMIMNVIWKRINDTGKNWRHVYKGLIVLEYLVAHGSERVIDDIKEHSYQISSLSSFQYIDSSGRDQGNNVRRKSQSLVALVNDNERIQEARQKAVANKDKYRSTFSTSGSNRPGSYSNTGGYGDRYDDDRFEGRYGNREEDRNGYGRERDWGHRDDERYGRGRNSFGRDGDRYGSESEERYGRDNYKDDDYRGGRGSDDRQFGPRNRSFERDGDRSYEDDDHHASRTGGRDDDHSQHERFERKLSEKNNIAPPSYEEASGNSQSPAQIERDGGTAAAPAPKASSPPPPKSVSPSGNTSQGSHNVAGGSFEAHNNNTEAFDEFDPRGPVSAAPPPASSTGMDFFGSSSASDSISSLALVPVATYSTPSEAAAPTSSSFDANFMAPPLASAVLSQASENPFGDSPFKATQESYSAPQQNFVPQASFQAFPESAPPAASFQPFSGSFGVAESAPPAAPVTNVEPIPTFDFGDSLGGITYTPSAANGQQSTVNNAFGGTDFTAGPGSNGFLDTLLPQTGPSQLVSSPAPQSFTHATSQPFAPSNVQSLNTLPQSGLLAPPVSQVVQPQGPSALSSLPPQPFTPATPQPFAPANIQSQQAGHLNALPQSGLSTSSVSQVGQPQGSSSLQTTYSNPFPQSSPLASEVVPYSSAGAPVKSHPAKEKFETKSTVWADTLSRGLVDLNISGAKINPLADIGIDFDSLNRKERIKEKEKSLASAATSTINMGKAMGAGSGIGRAGASGLAPPPNPMMSSAMGMGMGGSYGVGMNQPMGMGMEYGHGSSTTNAPAYWNDSFGSRHGRNWL